MRILFTISYYSPYISGLTIHAKRLAEYLAKKYKVSILTTRHTGELPPSEVYKSVSITRVPYAAKFSKGFVMPSYFLYVWRSIEDADIVISHLPQFEAVIVALIAKIQRRKFYCIYHCEIALPGTILNRIIQKMVYVSQFIALLLADRIITYTKDYAVHSSLLPFFSKKLKYNYPPVPVPVIDKERRLALLSKIPNKKKYTIGVAARFASEKGFEYLFEAIPFLEKKYGDDFNILIAGPKSPVGEESYWKAMQPVLERYRDIILFVGSVNSEEMGSFYSLLDVLVLPSVNKTEAFGMVQVEAMLSGVPVVASDLPGVRVPILETGMGELARKSDSRDLAKKITMVINNKKEYLIKQELVKEVFSPEKILREYNKNLSL